MSDITKIKTVLISNSERINGFITEALRKFPDIHITETLTGIGNLEHILNENKLAIAVLGPDLNFEDIERVIQNNEHKLRFVMVIALVHKVTENMLKRALKLGISDIIQIPFESDDFKDAIIKMIKILGQYASYDEENKVYSENKTKLLSKNIMVFSTKGGSGKSFVATSLAINLLKRSSKDVALFDMHYDTGDASLILNIYPKQTIFDLTMITENMTLEFLNSFLPTHPSGIKILPAPKDPSQSELIDLGVTIKMFDMLNKIFDYMVIDSPSRFSEEVLMVLKRLDWLCMVSSMDVASIKNLKVSLKLLRHLKFPDHKIITIMNRANTRVGIDINEIEATISRKIDIFIPSSIMVPISMNKGKSVIELYPKSAVAGSIDKLTSMILTK
jgi:pilus assembly protein CpaE